MQPNKYDIWSLPTLIPVVSNYLRTTDQWFELILVVYQLHKQTDSSTIVQMHGKHKCPMVTSFRVRHLWFTQNGTQFKVPIMSKNIFGSSNSTFHLMNFCEKNFRFRYNTIYLRSFRKFKVLFSCGRPLPLITRKTCSKWPCKWCLWRRFRNLDEGWCCFLDH